MLGKRGRKTVQPVAPAGRNGDILNVQKAAALLTVSADTVYDLFKSGELPGRKVGRKWITTRAALMRWIEGSFATDAAERAIAGGDKAALVKALKAGKVRVKGGAD
jgi:excisionase family DNA binding protein